MNIRFINDDLKKCDNFKRAFALPKSNRSTNVPCAIACIITLINTWLLEKYIVKQIDIIMVRKVKSEKVWTGDFVL